MPTGLPDRVAVTGHRVVPRASRPSAARRRSLHSRRRRCATRSSGRSKESPPRGTVTPNSACEVAERVTSGKSTPNDPRPASPISLPEDGVVLQGRGCIARPERNPRILRCDRRRPRRDPLSFLDNGAECVMEIAIQRYRSRRNMAARGRSPLLRLGQTERLPG